MLNKVFSKFIIPFIYSLAVTLGIYNAIFDLDNLKDTKQFIILSLIIFLIYTIEVFVNFKITKSEFDLKFNFSKGIGNLTSLVNKILIPILLFLSLVGFGFYNIYSSVWIGVLVIIFFIFFVLFINLRSSLNNNLNVEHKTHYIYDIAKFLIFFCTVDTLSNISNNNGSTFILSIILLVITMIIFLLMFMRNNILVFESFIYLTITSIIISISFFLLHYIKYVNSLRTSIFLLFIFYLAAGIIHHKIMKSLTRSVVLEYITVILLVLAVSYGIN